MAEQKGHIETAQRELVLEYVANEYGVLPQNTFRESPEIEVLRHGESGKWFGLIMPVERRKLGEIDPAKMNEYCFILNTKCDPVLIDFLIRKPGIIRSYHMNKKHWVSIFLDGSVEFDEIKQLIDMSFSLTMPKAKKKKVEH